MSDAAREFKPYVPADQHLPELTWRAVILGAVLGLVFSAVTVYLGLKAGLTVAVNIPISIIAMAFFAAIAKSKLGKPATVLENFINLDAWNSLPDDLKAIVEAANRAVNVSDHDRRRSAVLLHHGGNARHRLPDL